MGWYTHWDPSFDLSRGGVELSFRKTEDMCNLLVQTEAIVLAIKIAKNIKTSQIGTRYHVVGTRGLGKSTILNYFAYLLHNSLESERVIPVYATLLGEAKSETDLEYVFFRSLLESLFEIPSAIGALPTGSDFELVVSQLQVAFRDYKSFLERHGSVAFEFIYAAFENQLAHLRGTFQKIVFLIDGLDKQDTGVVLKFLRSTQERLNNIISKHDCVIVDSADPSWRETLETREFSGVRGVSINLRGWTVGEVEALIKKRLENAGIFSMPFERKALDILVEDFQGNPREILQYATALLHFAAKQRTQTIGPGMARKIVWGEEAKAKFFDKIIADPDIRYAFEKLKDLYKDRQMMNILIAVQTLRSKRLSAGLSYDERSAVGITLSDEKFQTYLEILINKGCLRQTRIGGFVELEEDLRKLLDSVVEMGQSLAALPVVLGDLESKVSPIPILPKEEVMFKDEIQKVFERHPNDWLSHESVKVMLFDNPKTGRDLGEHFKEDIERKTVSTVRLVVRRLKDEGRLMVDESSSLYRLRPSAIDLELAEFFKSKEILNEIESVYKGLRVEEIEKVRAGCSALLWHCLSNIPRMLGKPTSASKDNEILDFLDVLGVNTEKPVPLGLLLGELRETIFGHDEAKVIIDQTLLYAKRIYAKAKELGSYEAKNREIATKLESLKTQTSKAVERRDFNQVFLPLIKNNYGLLVEWISKIKMRKGFSETMPDELSTLLQRKFALGSTLLECPVCKRQVTVSAGSIEGASCASDKIPLKSVGQVYTLSERAHQAWTVWMEEYSRDALESLPCSYVRSGLVLKPYRSESLTTPDEVDVVVVYNGMSIAIECSENILCQRERDDIGNLVDKIKTLGLFDSVILVYRSVDDEHAFRAKVRDNEGFVWPLVVQRSDKFRTELRKSLAAVQVRLKKKTNQ